MDIKKELGKKIKLLRIDQGLSRQAICQDDALLTTRQLQRIEKGESIPNAQTALYLARQLGVTVDDLLDEMVYFLPQAYQEMKYQLFRLDHYGDPDKVAQREQLIESIYDQYFDALPEEEQITIQLMQASMDMIVSQNPDFDQGLVEELLPGVMAKKRLKLNDLLVMKLVMIQQAIEMAFDLKQLSRFEGMLKESLAYLPTNDLWLVQECLLNFAELHCYLGEFEKVSALLSVIDGIMIKRCDFQDKSIVLMLQWKLSLAEGDRQKAEEYYTSALFLCDMLHQDVVRKKIKEEWEQDKDNWIKKEVH